MLRHDELSLREVLRGFEAQRPQHVANMTMVPLVAQDRGPAALADPRGIELVEDRSYDTLVLSSGAATVNIVVQGLVFMTKEQAQDRTLPSAHLVGPKPLAIRAFCVQSSQGGLMQRDQTAEREFRLLPLSLRQSALQKRKRKGFDHLWGDLQAFNATRGVGDDLLRSLLTQHQRQLSEFVAEFEPVEGQCGALLLIDGDLAGLEVMPTAAAFDSIWEMLIRDCYGAEALATRDQAAALPCLALEEVDRLEDLPAMVEAATERETAWARESVEFALSGQAARQIECELAGLTLESLTGGDLAGQWVHCGGETLYLSLMRLPAERRAFRWN